VLQARTSYEQAAGDVSSGQPPCRATRVVHVFNGIIPWRACIRRLTEDQGARVFPVNSFLVSFRAVCNGACPLCRQAAETGCSQAQWVDKRALWNLSTAFEKINSELVRLRRLQHFRRGSCTRVRHLETG
jgi:hypothetical protein